MHLHLVQPHRHQPPKGWPPTVLLQIRYMAACMTLADLEDNPHWYHAAGYDPDEIQRHCEQQIAEVMADREFVCPKRKLARA